MNTITALTTVMYLLLVFIGIGYAARPIASASASDADNLNGDQGQGKGKSQSTVKRQEGRGKSAGKRRESHGEAYERGTDRNSVEEAQAELEEVVHKLKPLLADKNRTYEAALRSAKSWADTHSMHEEIQNYKNAVAESKLYLADEHDQVRNAVDDPVKEALDMAGEIDNTDDHEGQDNMHQNRGQGTGKSSGQGKVIREIA